MKKKLILQEQVERDILIYRNYEIWDSPERRRDKKMIREVIQNK